MILSLENILVLIYSLTSFVPYIYPVSHFKWPIELFFSQKNKNTPLAKIYVNKLDPFLG